MVVAESLLWCQNSARNCLVSHTGLTGIKFFFMPADGAQKVVWGLPPASWTYYA